MNFVNLDPYYWFSRLLRDLNVEIVQSFFHDLKKIFRKLLAIFYYQQSSDAATGALPSNATIALASGSSNCIKRVD